MELKDLPLKIQQEVMEYIEKNKLSEKESEELIQKVIKLYKESIYDPQEAIGIVTAQSLSEPATQMSVDYNEKVIVRKGENIKIVKIGEFVDKILEKEKQTSDGWEFCDISKADILVPSITKDEKIIWSRVKEVSRHKAPKHLVKIKTRSGRSIVATDSHSFVTRRNNSIVSVSGKDLKCGDRIPSIKYLPMNCLQMIRTTDIVNVATLKKPLPRKLTLDFKTGWIFGIYLAEGNTTRNFVSFSSTNESILSLIRTFAEEYGFTYNEYDNLRGFSKGHDIRINSTHLSLILKTFCKTGSANKKVPDFAYSANSDFVSGLLRGYFDGDGNVSVERRVIRVSSKSKELIDGIALLLTRFGIFAIKHKNKEYTLTVPYKYAPLFKEKIGFTVASKSKRLDQLCRMFGSNKEGCQDFIDLFGGFDTLLIDISKKLELPTRYVNTFTRRQKIGRITLMRHIKRFEKEAKLKGVNIDKEISILKRMYNSDVVWDEIVDISHVKPTSKYVYDFSVEGTETFTTFEGIVTHNTMRTYHFAGTAGIQVTLGLPRLIEIFDARKEPTTPTMTVYVKKEYQDMEKVKKIAEQIKEVKVKNIISSFSVDLTDFLLKCQLDIKKMKNLEIEPKKLEELIKIRGTKVEVKDGYLYLYMKKKDLKNIHKIKQSLLDSRVKGIKNISQTVIMKENDEWVINTLGSNLKKVFQIEGVDTTRTVSNNIFEIYDVLGIEAARNAIINQAKYTMDEQGLNTDIRYIMLLADLMTISGTIRSIGRYGISGQKAGVLVRAGFEETKKHFTIASVRGEVDELRGTVENVMMNQVAPIGTGAFELVGHIPGEIFKKTEKKTSKKSETKKKSEETKEKKSKK